MSRWNVINNVSLCLMKRNRGEAYIGEGELSLKGHYVIKGSLLIVPY